MDFAKNLLNEINRVRTQPQEVAEQLESFRQYYKDEEVFLPSISAFKTIEGIEGLNSAIEFLKKKTPIAPIQTLSIGLSKSAQDLCDDNGAKGLVGNTLSDGTSAPSRWSLYGTWKGKIGENIYFRIRDPKEIVSLWIIDDGNRTKPNRRTIMDEQYTTVGIGRAAHAMHGVIVSAIFTISYRDSSSLPPSLPSSPLSSSPSCENGGNENTTNNNNNNNNINNNNMSDGNNNNNYVIETERFGDDVDVTALKLTAVGKMLTLTRTFLLHGKPKRKNSHWQLPFSFDSTKVTARMVDHRAVISIPKSIGTVLHDIPIGKFSISPNHSKQNEVIEVETNFGLKNVTLAVIPSSYEETVNITLKGDVVLFHSSHLDDKGVVFTHNVSIRLPFVPTADQFSIAQEFPSLTLSIAKTTEEKIIPILSE